MASRTTSARTHEREREREKMRTHTVFACRAFCDDWWYLCFVFANLLADAKIGEAHVAVLVEEHVLGLLRSIGGEGGGVFEG
jgi:hypothetical protein